MDRGNEESASSAVAYVRGIKLKGYPAVDKTTIPGTARDNTMERKLRKSTHFWKDFRSIFGEGTQQTSIFIPPERIKTKPTPTTQSINGNEYIVISDDEE